MTSSLVYAHQGGWDEALYVLVPILVVVGLLRLAKHRVEQGKPDEPAGLAGDPAPAPAPDGDASGAAPREDGTA